jgi:hypothetical protein
MLRVSLLTSSLIFVIMSGYPGIIIIKATAQTLEEKCDCVRPSHCNYSNKNTCINTLLNGTHLASCFYNFNYSCSVGFE